MAQNSRVFSKRRVVSWRDVETTRSVEDFNKQLYTELKKSIKRYGVVLI